jgi:hypothetical protein
MDESFIVLDIITKEIFKYLCVIDINRFRKVCKKFIDIVPEQKLLLNEIDELDTFNLERFEKYWDPTLIHNLVRLGKMEHLKIIDAAKFDNLSRHMYIMTAAMHGRVEFLSRYTTHEYFLQEFFEAARYNHLECIKFMYPKLHEEALKNWDLRRFRSTDSKCWAYLKEDCGYNLNFEMAMIAVEMGSVPCLEYVFQNNIQWDIGSMNLAIAYNRFECFKYLYDHGMRVGSDQIYKIITCERPHFMDYIKKNPH